MPLYLTIFHYYDFYSLQQSKYYILVFIGLGEVIYGIYWAIDAISWRVVGFEVTLQCQNKQQDLFVKQTNNN